MLKRATLQMFSRNVWAGSRPGARMKNENKGVLSEPFKA
jgi:hypothetical protein